MKCKCCTACKVKKSLTEFHKNRCLPLGVQNKCKECKKIYDRQWRIDNIDRHIKARRKSHLKKAYSITPEEYDEMCRMQSSCCAICGTHQKDLKFILCVDHDHNTNDIRGLLCQSCNTGLGCFKDNTELLENAINYVKGRTDEDVK